MPTARPNTPGPHAALVLALAAFAAPALAQPLVNPRDGAEASRALTPAERDWLKSNPITVPEATTPPPVGPVRTVAEYEPMEGLVFSWEGTTQQQTILRNMIRQITVDRAVAAQNALVWICVDSTTRQNSVTTTLTNAGVDMAKVRWIVRTMDTIWIRDYGPRYIYQGDVRAITDHIYNRPRPNDDATPFTYAQNRRHAYYEMNLIHGGGNYHLNALNKGYATELILNENPSLTQAQVLNTWLSYQNQDVHLFPAFPTSVDLTQHIDMWMQVIGDNKVIISDWDVNPGSTQDVVCDNAALYMASQGYTVTRVPARLQGSIHYTYTNMVIVNNLVLLPTYNSIDPAVNAQALANVQAAFGPSYTVVQILSDSLASSAGVMHCIVQHIPRNKNGVNPGAFLISTRSAPTLTPGQSFNIDWASDDDLAVTRIDLQLSTDGGATYPTTIATNLQPVVSGGTTGRFAWTVPNVFAPSARIRVIAYDAQGNTGADDGGVNFLINGTPCVADVSRDGLVDLTDFFQFLNDFDVSDPGADIDGVPGVDLGDFFTFLNAFDAGCNP